MINLNIKTEFSFKKCFQPLESILTGNPSALGIADLHNTYGHIKFEKLCKSKGTKPIFGVQLNVMDSLKDGRRWNTPCTFIAVDNNGLKEIYKLVSLAYKQFYYIPRITLEDIHDLTRAVLRVANPSPAYPLPIGKSSLISPSELATFDYIGIYPGLSKKYLKTSIPHLALQNNLYPTPADKEIYQLLAGARKHGEGYIHNFENTSYPSHILSAEEWLRECCDAEALLNTYKVADMCNASIEHADMVEYDGHNSIFELCLFNAERKGIDLDDPIYAKRFQYEMNLIKDKGYNDYFLIVADMINFAKRSMLVGPSRGSSAGSLVCYLLNITEVEPIRHGLIFERFIDINRFDLPDIDIDFPDVKRENVVKYLSDKYGSDNVRCLGTISRLMPKSAIGEFAQSLGIPKYETDDVKNSIIERSSGDARAAMCIADTFETTEVGKEFINNYPKMSLVSKVEGHARHSGKHAAGILVSTLPLWNYGSIDSRDDVIQMDKKDAEEIGLLKIDCLGLRTLSILEEAAQIAGFNPKDYYTMPLDDEKTFDVFNRRRLNGIFQFEGYALQSLTRQMGVQEFNDIVAITSLARPGALNSGGASRYVEYKTGRKEPRYFNSIHEEITKETFGIVIYQEQMMEISRKIGKLSWADTSDLRRAASKSLGDEFFSKYKEKFVEGAKENGMTDNEAENCWTDIMSFGSWAFNKSHAVSYGLISYWTAYMKAHHPLAFATASLNNARDDSHAIKLLRDMVKYEKIRYIPVDPDISDVNWSVNNEMLIGGLTNVKGIGISKARKIIKAREGNGNLTPSLLKAMLEPKTEFDILFPAQHYWGDLYDNPQSVGLSAAPANIEDIDKIGYYTFIGCLVDRNLRDLNEYNVVAKRGGTLVDEYQFYLNMTVEDDTDSIICTINRYKFDELCGRKIAEESKVGETWFLISGRIKDNWRRIDVEYIYNLNEWRQENESGTDNSVHQG